MKRAASFSANMSEAYLLTQIKDILFSIGKDERFKAFNKIQLAREVMPVILAMFGDQSAGKTSIVNRLIRHLTNNLILGMSSSKGTKFITKLIFSHDDNYCALSRNGGIVHYDSFENLAKDAEELYSQMVKIGASPSEWCGINIVINLKMKDINEDPFILYDMPGLNLKRNEEPIIKGMYKHIIQSGKMVIVHVVDVSKDLDNCISNEFLKDPENMFTDNVIINIATKIDRIEVASDIQFRLSQLESPIRIVPSKNNKLITDESELDVLKSMELTGGINVLKTFIKKKLIDHNNEHRETYKKLCSDLIKLCAVCLVSIQQLESKKDIEVNTYIMQYLTTNVQQFNLQFDLGFVSNSCKEFLSMDDGYYTLKTTNQLKQYVSDFIDAFDNTLSTMSKHECFNFDVKISDRQYLSNLLNAMPDLPKIDKKFALAKHIIDNFNDEYACEALDALKIGKDVDYPDMRDLIIEYSGINEIIKHDKRKKEFFQASVNNFIKIDNITLNDHFNKQKILVENLQESCEDYLEFNS